MYAVLIGSHAVAGALAFVAGLLALRRDRFLAAYRPALAATVLLLALAVGIDLPGREVGGLLIPGVLLLLGAVMVVRAERAPRVSPSRVGERSAAYVHHVGFGVVGLFDAFWIVTMQRAGLPGGALLAVGLGIAVVGHLLLARLSRSDRPVARGTASRALPAARDAPPRA